jgi:hypothetical protein
VTAVAKPKWSVARIAAGAAGAAACVAIAAGSFAGADLSGTSGVGQSLSAQVLHRGQLASLAAVAGAHVRRNARAFVAAEGLAGASGAAERARLHSLRFVAGVVEELRDARTPALRGMSEVIEFHSSRSAKAQLAHTAALAGWQRFRVATIPGASGLARDGGAQVAFAVGVDFYLEAVTSNAHPPSALPRRALVAAAEIVYRRVRG